jgi:hypothetical protein
MHVHIALLITVPKWKLFTYASTGEWMEKCGFSINEILFSNKKLLINAMISMDHNDIMLSEKH